jgi:oxygen-independent coproporphyrinogen III oxidase
LETVLYIHIPYCVSKCSYCDFFSISCGTSRIPNSYISALLHEVAFRVQQYGVTGWKTVYIGGGTPSLLCSGQLKDLLGGVLGIFPGKKPVEVSMEVNPDDVSEQLLDAIACAGVTRISCGIQAFDNSSLESVHRRSGAASVRHALDCLREHWHGILSVDMIAGLPVQTEQAYNTGLSALISYRPAHISLYSLTIEEETPLGQAVAAGDFSYDYDEADRRWIVGRDFLVKNGWNQYEISNFCLPGYECRHNMAYWRLENYIGTGAGATGTIYCTGNTIRWTNTRNITSYISSWTESVPPVIPEEIELIDKKTEEFEFFMMGLRTADGICADVFYERFGSDFPGPALRLFDKWQKCGRCRYYEYNGHHFYALTPVGMLFLNAFLESLEF